MSILLDALRKSEAQRRLGEIPTLQTHVSLDEGRGGERPAWLPFALILLSAAIMTWTGINQFALDESGPGTTRQAVDSAGSEVADSRSEPEPVAEPDHAAESRPAGNRTRAKSGAATPVQDYVAENPPRTSRADRQNAGRKAGASGASRTPAGVAAVPRSGTAAPSRSVTHVEVGARTASESVDTAQSGEDANTGAASPPSTDPVTFAPQTISYWQLPQALREELGEFQISVLVFAANPQDRFLLVNGSRLSEQQETESGAMLEEIQRDRAVFSFRNYRFHVTN